MGVHQQYRPEKHPNSSSARLLHLTIPSTSNFVYDKNDFIWNNPNELDLLDLKKAPLMPTMNENCFLKVLPCIRRLFTLFNSICPNIYRIHCSDSLRVLQEIICLTDEYLHIHPSSSISVNELLYNEDYFDDFLHKLRLSPLYHFYPDKYSSASIKTEIHCFGQGIHACDYNNQLNQRILFCFELTTTTKNNCLSSINVLILDPNENIVSNDIKYINTYDQGYTKLYSCSYKPITQAGTYKISVFYNNISITNYPYAIFIRNSNVNAKADQQKQEFVLEDMKKINGQEILPQYELEGDGCFTKVIVNSTARFRLRILSHNKSIVDCFSLSIIDPFGHTIVVQRRILSPDLLELIYQPMSIGAHQLSISFNNKLDRQLIIDVIHDELNYLSKLKPFGPGLKRAIAGLPTEFYVDLNQQTIRNHTINHDHLQFCLEPSYHAEIDYEQQLATVRYVPSKEGDYPVHILEYNKDIPHSPFIAHIKNEVNLQEKPCIRVTGLSQQIVIHRPVEFQVFIDNPFDDTTNSLNIEILTDENPPSVSIRRRRDRSSYTCSFIPTTLGRHLISIDYAGIVAEHNPFLCEVIQGKDIELTGPAINNQCLVLNEPTHFYFKLNDFLTKNSNDKSLTYESGYSSNDDTSMNSSTTDKTKENDDDTNNYRVTITDGHGNKKSNVSIQEILENTNDNVRVDFTPDEQILFINISCTW